MANPEHLAILRKGVEAWNEWRRKNPEVVPHLPRADLREANLFRANLEGANLKKADLKRANLASANLEGANLGGADLRGANLEGADLIGTKLLWAKLRGAKLPLAKLPLVKRLWARLRGAKLRAKKNRGSGLVNGHEGRCDVPANLPTRRVSFMGAAKRIWARLIGEKLRAGKNGGSGPEKGREGKVSERLPPPVNPPAPEADPILRPSEGVFETAEPEDEADEADLSDEADIADDADEITDTSAPEKQQRLTRFSNIKFPEQCKLNSTVLLSIQLTMSPIPEHQKEPGPPVTDMTINPNREEIRNNLVELIVFVSTDSFELADRWQTINVPFDRDSETITFELKGTSLGPKLIEVEFYHGTARVGYVVIETKVIEDQTTGEDAQATYENVSVTTSTDDPKAANTLIANWEEAGKLTYWIMKEAATFPADGGTATFQNQDIAAVDFLSTMSQHFGDLTRSRETDASRIQSLWLHMKGWGKELYNKVIPAELQQISRQWPNDSVIIIATNEKWIPWELLHDGDEFWGKKFIISRIPKIPGHDAFSENDNAVEKQPSPNVRKLINVIGGQMKPAAIIQKLKAMFSAYDSTVLPLEKTTPDILLQAIAETDILHFTCHGHTKPQICLQIGEDTTPFLCLTLTTLNEFPPLPGSLVFANACSSAGVSLFLDETRTFGWEFYKKGVAGYIGTFSLVPTEYAVAFAETFYEKLFAGGTVGEALHHAKSRAEQSNPFWLFYTLYGDPFTRKIFDREAQTGGMQ